MKIKWRRAFGEQAYIGVLYSNVSNVFLEHEGKQEEPKEKEKAEFKRMTVSSDSISQHVTSCIIS